MNFLSKYIVCCSSYISMDCFEACWSVSVSKWFNTTGIEKSFEAVGACPMCSSGVYSFTRFSPFRWGEWLLYAWFRRCCQESLQYVWSTLWRSFQFKFLWRNLCVPKLLCDLQARALVLQSLTFRLSAVSIWSMSFSLLVETEAEEREGEGREVVCT